MNTNARSELPRLTRATSPVARSDRQALALAISPLSPLTSSKKGSSPTSWLCSRMIVRSRRERLCLS